MGTLKRVNILKSKTKQNAIEPPKCHAQYYSLLSSYSGPRKRSTKPFRPPTASTYTTRAKQLNPLEPKAPIYPPPLEDHSPQDLDGYHGTHGQGPVSELHHVDWIVIPTVTLGILRSKHHMQSQSQSPDTKVITLGFHLQSRSLLSKSLSVLFLMRDFS